MQGTIILPCKCSHQFQDMTYGFRNRVHNISQDMKKAFCTVCVGSGVWAKRLSKSSPPTTSRDSKGI